MRTSELAHDFFFVSYDEPNCERNWRRALEVIPNAKRLHGIKGGANAFLALTRLSTTEHFYFLDADAELMDGVRPEDLHVDSPRLDTTYIFPSKNVVNGILSGNSGLKLFPRTGDASCFDTQDWSCFWTPKQTFVERALTWNRFNTSPLQAWRTGFREGLRLADGSPKTGWEAVAREFLEIWCNVGAEVENGTFAIAGARAGRQYAQENLGNLEALRKLDDYRWLLARFEEWSAHAGVSVPTPSVSTSKRSARESRPD